jgi:hypothetical protein
MEIVSKGKINTAQGIIAGRGARFRRGVLFYTGKSLLAK